MPLSRPEPRRHEPVLRDELLRLLEPRPGQVVVDATLGSGGHAREILERLGPTGRLIGIDQDPEAIERARENLKAFSHVEFIPSNFRELDRVLERLNLKSVDAVILDVGISTEQLEEARRGFSFLKEGPLDMRMSPEGPLRARDLVNDLSQGELEKLFRTYGEERWAKRIAGTLCRHRTRKPIETTGELVQVIQKAVPRPFHFGPVKRLRRHGAASRGPEALFRGGPRHPATRVFQALRIRVNQELEALEEVLPKALQALRPGGRLAAITFHSLEDRIVKWTFNDWSRQGSVRILTRKPVRPTPEEIQRNPRSRSAKLRALEKL